MHTNPASGKNEFLLIVTFSAWGITAWRFFPTLYTRLLLRLLSTYPSLSHHIMECRSIYITSWVPFQLLASFSSVPIQFYTIIVRKKSPFHWREKKSNGFKLYACVYCIICIVHRIAPFEVRRITLCEALRHSLPTCNYCVQFSFMCHHHEIVVNCKMTHVLKRWNWGTFSIHFFVFLGIFYNLHFPQLWWW